METAIGVFVSRERAEEAVKNLLEHQVPEESIVYLTRSETEAKTVGKQVGAYAGGFVGGAAGMSTGVVAATLLAIPGVGPVFALGFGAAALLGLVGAGAGASVGGGTAENHDAPAASSGIGSSDDVAFFRKVLSEGYSLIIVRTDSSSVAASACAILDRLGMSMKSGAAIKASVSTRQLEGAVVADFTGKIALAEGTDLLRDTVRALLQQGNNRILLNLEAVEFIDSADLGEFVRTHATVRSHGGMLRLLNPSASVHNL